ncbi:hypothetical protein AZE42_12490 [Rhizopogon vesiculosus]|uniref:Uncharacterized protein n=1 Tax=Rhizopogon vesiculosus TaxID=180088 RepID=A0A1J8Q4W5_9AGAM|nr:hypothetical protein AZE42_12490 [Rhizopogon vesiculosus]
MESTNKSKDVTLGIIENLGFNFSRASHFMHILGYALAVRTICIAQITARSSGKVFDDQ